MANKTESQTNQTENRYVLVEDEAAELKTEDTGPCTLRDVLTCVLLMVVFLEWAMSLGFIIVAHQISDYNNVFYWTGDVMFYLYGISHFFISTSFGCIVAFVGIHDCDARSVYVVAHKAGNVALLIFMITEKCVCGFYEFCDNSSCRSCKNQKYYYPRIMGMLGVMVGLECALFTLLIAINILRAANYTLKRRRSQQGLTGLPVAKITQEENDDLRVA